MRSKDEVEKKLMELYEKRLKLRIRKYLKKGYLNCKHNKRLVLNGDRQERVGCCTNNEIVGTANQIVVCNDDAFACACQKYCNENNRHSVEHDFTEDISNPKICGQKEPKIAVLLWVLHNNEIFPDDEEKNSGVFDRLWEKILGLFRKNGRV